MLNIYLEKQKKTITYKNIDEVSQLTMKDIYELSYKLGEFPQDMFIYLMEYDEENKKR